MAHEICVSNPRRIGEGVGAYISYVVQTSGEFDGAQGVRDVNRRYSDSDWLRNELLKEWPGCGATASFEASAVQAGSYVDG